MEMEKTADATTPHAMDTSCGSMSCLVGLVFVLRELDPPLPPRKGGYRVGAQTTTTTRKAIMTDPPTDDTEAREPDAPGTTDAKHRAPLHGHTGGVPSDKALSDMLTSHKIPHAPERGGKEAPAR
eukprot:scaffold16508_cov108-Isochrysis_galbana.AAC.3